MAARRISLLEDLWNREGSRGLELGVWRAEAGEAEAVVSTDRQNEKLAAASEMAYASDGGEGRFSAWLMRASHLDAGSLSSITRTLPALRGTTSWNLHCNCGGKNPIKLLFRLQSNLGRC